MDEDNKLPLKRVEFSLTKFNEVAIPHHLDLLRQHKANIIKYEEQGELSRARSEQTHARRVAAQLRALLLEMDALRSQVRAQDRARFDQLTQRSRDTTLKAIVDYLGLIESSCRALVWSPPTRVRLTGTSPLSINRLAPEPLPVAGSAVSTDSVGVVAHAERDVVALDDAQIQLRIEDHEETLRSREALLVGWSELQAEVRALHDVWQHAQAAALAQRDQVTTAAGNVDVAADNVAVARTHLSSAEKLRAGAYGVGGACLGALVGGPLGLVAGAKAGALAAAAGSLLGYFGAKVLGRHAQREITYTPPADSDVIKDKDQ